MKKLIIISLSTFFTLAFGSVAFANGLPDADSDGVPDRDETEVYYTDPAKADTDGDGYNDFEEINSGYSPVNKEKLKLIDSDIDKDGLTEAWEIKFKTNPTKADSDGDGFKDGDEADKGYDPAKSGTEKLDVSIRINLKGQTLDYLLNGFIWKSFSISSGKASMPTPTGEFTIGNKVEKAWSRAYGLWMPHWLGIKGTRIGIHELPVWPNGYREGSNHLGKPVSHGCVRLGVGAAEYIYERADVGMKVLIR